MSSQQLRITLAGSEHVVEAGTTAGAVLGSPGSPGPEQGVIAARVNGELRDLAHQVADGDVVEPVAVGSDDGRYIVRHSAAHVMAEAIQTVIPGTKLGFGPAIDDGFYYDVDAPRPITEDDFPAIEAEMARIIASKAPFGRSVMSIDDARAFFGEQGENFKVDQIDFLAGQGESTVSLYRDRDFVDLCRGPHVQDTGRIGPVKLMSVAGAYWRGSEKNPQLTRLDATTFTQKKDLEA